MVNRSEYNSNQSQKSNKEKKNIFKCSNVTRNIREYNADLRKPQDTGRSRADAQKDITSTEFNNIEDAYNV